MKTCREFRAQDRAEAVEEGGGITKAGKYLACYWKLGGVQKVIWVNSLILAKKKRIILFSAAVYSP